MHASVGRRRGREAHNEVTHVVMNDFPLINDHAALLQGRDKSKIYPAGFSTNSRPIQGGGVRNNTGYNDSRTINGSCGKRNVYPQTQSAEARLFSAEYNRITNVSDVSSSEGNTMRTQDEHKDKGKDLFLSDWPELGRLEDFETDMRKLGSKFEIRSNYFEDPMWYSICSPDVRLVPSSYHFDNPNLSNVPSERPTNPILKSSVSVPDTTSIEPVFLAQMVASRHPESLVSKGNKNCLVMIPTSRIDMANPIDMQQPFRNEGRETPLNCEAHACSSSEEIEHFSQHSDSDLCPFDDMLVPTTSGIMCNDEIVSSSTCSGPDLVAAYAPHSTQKSHDPSNATPDMILDGMAANPLEMYFPPLATYEQPEQLMNDTSAQMHPFTEDFAGDDALNSADLQFCSKGKTSAGLCENPHSSVILEAVPVKHLGFQKLQEGMNQLDVGTKTCIRDALYRLANSVEQKHCVNQRASGVVESSGANRFKSSIWTEIQASSMDRSVAQLLLQKPLYQKTGLPNPPCQSNHVI